ncbi:DUF167 domain-containing protein [Leisingera caerulea]|uniref:DUF167 domain-containing protein n=1 Tax=Leisingera caerulea TaxID=506591 RepID=UPI0021A304E0|nr:DUF167 domain-containing protein [Leisingera caerulea]UWQ50804.1 DUF167 domain-containing protein [Leisingera caerulea]
MGKPKKKDLPDLSHLCVQGTEIAVRATPKAARNAIVAAEGILKISVTAAPENGKANDAIRRLLAAAMGTAASRLELRRGAAARDKLFVYQGAD